MAVDFNKLVLQPCIAIFGEPVKYNPRLGPAQFCLNGVFDKAYTEIVVHDGVPVTQTLPVLGVKLEDFPSPPLQGDHLLARGDVYKVREVRIDSHGGAKLMLNFVSDFVWPSPS